MFVCLFVCLLVGLLMMLVVLFQWYINGLRPLALVGAGSQDVILPWIM
jgi:hypothetical protein